MSPLSSTPPRHDVLGRQIGPYVLLNIVAGGQEEVLYLAEHIDTGTATWIRAARYQLSEEGTARLKRRYAAELKASQVLRQMESLLPVQEILTIQNIPALVSLVPAGESLNTILATHIGAHPIAEVLPWFDHLLRVMEIAHSVGAAHGSLDGRAVYLDSKGRVTLCGLAWMENDASSQKADVRGLATLLYHVTAGRAPRTDFPDTGIPPSPELFVDNYPETLARFLCRRLASDTVDPVVDASVFRRSLDAMRVDPVFRRAAGLNDALDGQVVRNVVIERVQRQRQWRQLIQQVGGAGLLILCSVLITMTIMQSHVVPLGTSLTPALGSSASATGNQDGVVHGRKAIWNCLHTPYVDGRTGTLSAREVTNCLRLAPDIARDELRMEARRILETLSNRPRANASTESIDASYRRLFAEGPGAVQEFLAYRLDRQLATSGIEGWIQEQTDEETAAVLQTLAVTTGPIGTWAQRVIRQKQEQ